jgi:Tol biopolymer transport system component
MGADGKGPVNLTRNAAFDSDPSWSPDGKHILFTSNRQEGGFRLFVMDAEGGNVRQLVDRVSPPTKPLGFSPQKLGGICGDNGTS